MDDRRPGRHRRDGIEDRRQLLELDLDQFQRALGGFLVHRGDGGDLVAHVPDARFGEDLLVLARRADAVPLVRHVGAGDHGEHAAQGARFRHVDPPDESVGDGAPEDLADDRVREPDVRGVLGAPGDLVGRVVSRHAVAHHVVIAPLVALGVRVGLRVKPRALELLPPRHCLEHPRIRGAAAQVARERFLDLVVRRRRVRVDERLRRHERAARAVAALDRAVLHEGLLQRVQLAVVGEPLDRRDALPLGGDREQEA
jgi:hypothetical protein